MPSLEWNHATWDQTYTWPDGGEEWSREWGGSESQWFFSIFPRIHLFLPVGTILEIAPGQGRWTHYLKNYCRQLIGVDFSDTCAEACRCRFAEVSHATFFVNDGYSLPMIPNGAVDFAFSFGSLVHAECDVVTAYLGELAKKLSLSGVAFLHHSHLAAYRDPHTGQIPATLKNPHLRALTVSAQVVAEECERVRLRCISQEIVSWGEDHLSDCFSVVTPLGSAWEKETLVIENPDFMKEASHICRVSRPYVRGSVLATLEGSIDRVDGGGIAGWAWDSARPDSPVRLEVYNGQSLLATITADQFRQDLLKSGKGDGRHAFRYAIPPNLRNGEVHQISVRFAGTAKNLRGPQGKSIPAGAGFPPGKARDDKGWKQ